MIADFEEFCLWLYVVVDDLWQALPPGYKPSRGPQPACSDSELITLALIGDCRGWHRETDLLSAWRAYRPLFPHLPERSRFNRRRRNLCHAINAIRRSVLAVLDVAQDCQCAIDSLPVPVMQFHLVPGAPSKGTWKAHGAAFGKVTSKKQTIFGYKLHLLVTLGGVIRDFVLAPANVNDLSVGAELLREQCGLLVIGDKAYISADVAEELSRDRGITLLTVPRRGQLRQLSAAATQLHNHVRQIVETVNGQLTEQLGAEAHHAHSFWGLCARLLTKLTAHTLCIYLNRLQGATHCLQIKSLAFPRN